MVGFFSMHILCIFACATNKNSLDCFDKLFRQLIEFSLRFSHIVVACNYIVRRNVAQLKKKRHLHQRSAGIF